MATSAAPSEGDRINASSVYRLGDAVVRFRYYAELNYAGADDTDDFGGGPPVVPRVIEKCFGEVLDNALRTADALPVVSGDAQTLVTAARSVRDRIGQIWLDADHCARIRRRRADAELAVATGRCYFDWLILSGSPLAPPAWAEYQAAADRLQGNLPGVCGALFRLSRLLAGISNPLPSDYDDELGDIPALDTDRLLTVFGSQVVELVRAVRAGSGLLEGVDQRFKGSDAYGSAVHLHRKLTRLLVQNRDRDSDRRASQAGANPAVPPSSTPTPVAPAIPKEPSETVTIADVTDLLALRKQMDEKGEYIGVSRAVLQLFRRIEELNRLPKDPVVILGESGSGKTSPCS